MPKIIACGKTIECPEGANLRQVLLESGIDLYNGNARIINCRGLGSCGTCAIAAEGSVSPPAWKEKARLNLPPHAGPEKRRLACQVKVLGDVRVTKFDGFWGQKDEVRWTPEG